MLYILILNLFIKIWTLILFPINLVKLIFSWFFDNIYDTCIYIRTGELVYRSILSACGSVRFAKIWLMLMLILKCCKRKTLSVRWKYCWKEEHGDYMQPPYLTDPAIKMGIRFMDGRHGSATLTRHGQVLSSMRLWPASRRRLHLHHQNVVH